jgi:hypothetical protein
MPPLALASTLRLAAALALPDDSAAFVRVNQVGYLPDAPKTAVVCALRPVALRSFTVEDGRGRPVLGPRRAVRDGAFGPCVETYRLDFSGVRAVGTYVVRAGRWASPAVRVDARVYAGLADTMLGYMRQQRSGWNPFLADSAHGLDGIVVDHPVLAGRRVAVTGGWGDAADYLQYGTTSATATHHLLMAWRDAPHAFGDAHDARGDRGANGIPDVLDEARHGLAWLSRMMPDDTTLLHQIGDDRDHAYPDLITTDSSDYGWGKGRERAVYACTGRPQGLFQWRNRSSGVASIAGKYAAAFAWGARTLGAREPALADTLRHKARAAYALGVARPGACPGAPGRAPYFYEEETWADDMALGASALAATTGERAYLRDGLAYVRRDPAPGWMGADTARHYEFYPFHNAAHVELHARLGARERREVAGHAEAGLRRVAQRATNGFRIGVPFIWCSSDLVASFAIQAAHWRRMTGRDDYRAMEQAAVDWLFGANPWGTSFVIGVPRAGSWPRRPHTTLPDSLQHGLTGGLVDGPVYRTIFATQRAVRLTGPDRFAAFNTGRVVYHDDPGDYVTNEHIMDGTASVLYLVATLAPPSR